MNGLLLELAPYLRRGHCCSQLLADLALAKTGKKAPELVHAMKGLCLGIGGAGCDCGLLSGGAAILAWLSCPSGQEAHPMLDALTNDYANWFLARTAASGSRCDGILDALSASSEARPAPQAADMALCTDLLSECWQKILDLCEEYDIEAIED